MKVAGTSASPSRAAAPSSMPASAIAARESTVPTTKAAETVPPQHGPGRLANGRPM